MKTNSKCSFTSCKLRFFVYFRLVLISLLNLISASLIHFRPFIPLLLIGLGLPANADELSDNQCGSAVSSYKLITAPPGEIRFSAESMEIEKQQKITLKGHVEILTPQLQLKSDKAQFDIRDQLLKSNGRLTVKHEEFQFTGDILSLNLKNKEGSAWNTKYQINHSMGHGSAQSIHFQGSKLSLNKAQYTTCPTDREAWKISARKISLDRDQNEGIARGAILRLFSVPVLYIPYISFPIEGRKTGFLAPTPYFSSTDGIGLQVPYYFNLAPNYDLTFTPRLLQKRGTRLSTEFRYLQQNFAGEMGVEYLPNDKKRLTDRYQLHFDQENYISENTRLTTNLTDVSDRYYYSDLGTSISTANQPVLDRNITLETSGRNWFFQGLLQDYQVLTDIQEPYRRIPQLDFEAQNHYHGLQGRLFSQYSYFYKASNDYIHRLVLNPKLSLPVNATYGYITPEAGIYSSLYQTPTATLSHQQGYVQLTGALYLDRKFGNGQQTLIPHFSYLNMPYTQQSNMPEIDSIALSPQYEQLFTSRRYSGWDRYGDIHRLSLGLQNQWNKANGDNIARVNLATARILSNQKSNLANDVAYHRGDMFYGASFEVSPINPLLLSGEVLSMNRLDIIQSSAVSAKLSTSNGNQMEIRNDFRTSILNQSTFILIQTLGSRWRIAARVAYSHQYQQMREGLLGLEYNNCCWSIRAVARRYANVIGEQARNSVALQFELKGLTAIGTSLEDTFSQELFGIY